MIEGKAKAGGSYLLAGVSVTARPLEPALYLVATPIGNLGDITIRALETLAAADIIACEDTRTSRVLLDRYGIRTKTVSYHDHNQAVAGARLIETLQAGKICRAHHGRRHAAGFGPRRTARRRGADGWHPRRSHPRRVRRSRRADGGGAACVAVFLRRLPSCQDRPAPGAAGEFGQP